MFDRASLRSVDQIRGCREANISRGLDHIVHAVRDLDAAAALYGRLGFRVGARNRHPPAWGTQNHIVQLPCTFVELLAVTDAAGIAPHAEHVFSFGAFNRDFLARQQGLSMLVLEGKGAAVDAAAFRAAGIGDFKVYDFERDAKRPDGSSVKVAFSLVFAADRNAPDTAYFTSQQHYPENFWNPAFQNHANGARGVAGVVMVAENPADHHTFLKAFSGVTDLTSTSSGITLETERGEIQVMDPAAYTAHFAVEPPDVMRGARLAALRFSVRSRAALTATLATGGIAAAERMDKLIVGPQQAFGATLVFEPAAD